jgi:replicative DNA helicase
MIDINLDMRTLDIMCRALVTDTQIIRRGQLINLRNLIYLLNPSIYENDIEKREKIIFIKKGIEARLDYNLTSPHMILSHINGSIIDAVNLSDYQDLSSAEINWMNNMVSEALKYTHVYNNVDKLMDICTKIRSKDYTSKSEVVSEFEKTINNIQNDFRRAKNETQTESVFSLQDGYFEDTMYDTYNTLNSPRRKLVTGMQGMNELLGGGFENGRCYVYFGLPGEGKSTIILNMIYQIKKYNRDYKTKDPTKRPCIVLLTMENTVTESVERLFGMATGRSSMTDYEPENVIKMLRDEGELYLNDSSPIDIIIKFKPSNSVDTSYLYTLTEDLEDQGLEVIALFQDYIGRIRSTERLQDTRLEYGMIVDEFKTFAEIKDIPIITVAQLNRDASKHIDEGRKASKSDLVRLIGRSNISESMLILNNIDAGFLIAPETTGTNERFLGVQRIKIRYNAGNREFVYLPFSKNTLKLLEDYGGIANFKSTMRPESPHSNESIIKSPYHTNAIMDMGQVMPQNSSDSNIFSTNVISSDNISTLEADKPAKKVMKDCMIFFD